MFPCLACAVLCRPFWFPVSARVFVFVRPFLIFAALFLFPPSVLVVSFLVIPDQTPDLQRAGLWRWKRHFEVVRFLLLSAPPPCVCFWEPQGVLRLWNHATVSVRLMMIVHDENDDGDDDSEEESVYCWQAVAAADYFGEPRFALAVV